MATTMTSRERVRTALEHREPDRVPLDLGGTRWSGIHGESYARLKQALGIEGSSVRVHDVYQMICEVELPVVEALGADAVPVNPLQVAFGLRNHAFKPLDFWWTPPSVVTEVPVDFDPVHHPDGSLTSVDGEAGREPREVRMPERGWYFDRIEPTGLSDAPELEDVGEFRAGLRRLNDEELDFVRGQCEALWAETDKALVGGFYLGGLTNPPSMSFGDWMVAHLTEHAYIHELFAARADVAIENLEAYRDAVGDRIEAVGVSGVDFGTQKAEMFSPDLFRELYVPHMRRINGWIHEHTRWKVLYHSDGSLQRIIGYMIDAEVDALNPVQCSAADMGADGLKAEFGERLTFWGAGPNVQETLPFGTPEEVCAAVRERVATMAPGGGFVFANMHNIQAQIPTENLLAMFEEFEAVRDYPLPAAAPTV